MSLVAESREQRKRKLGVDCVGRVVWRHWEPEHEYVKKIRIRNVDARPQTIEYKQPLRKDIFFIDFPEPVTLSSGMSFDLEVRYCPTDFVELHDVIKVTVVGRGSFVVQLECETPYARLQVPSHHDFMYTAVGSTATHTVTMKNTGTVPVQFAWDVVEPFAVVPDRGVLDEEETIQLQLSFTPQEASALVAQVVCKMVDNGEVLARMKLSGLGKYPFLRVANGEAKGETSRGDNSFLIDFGRQLVNTTCCRVFELENPSLVDAVFTLETTDDSHLQPFKITPKSGVIERGQSKKFKVLFSPTAPSTTYTGTFRAVMTTGNAVSARVRGVSVPPVVHTSTSAIDFGDVRLEEVVGVAGANKPSVRKRFFLIKNASEAPLSFFFVSTSPGAAFVVEPSLGELPAKGHVRVSVEFCPTHPINYLRRMLILVQHVDTLLYVDVFGSAYNSVIRPLPFKAKDVEAFFQRHECGLAGARPDDLVVMSDALQNGDPHDDGMHWLLSKESEEQLPQQNRWQCTTKSSVSKRRKGRLDFSHLRNLFSESAPFYLGTDTLLFPSDRYESQQITVHNKTDTFATAYWCVPAGSPFYVTPLQEDVPPCSFCIFTVAMTGDGFVSGVADYFLECYMNFKQMRSFRLVDEGGFTPPHCFTLRCQREVTGAAADAGTCAPFIRATKLLFFPASRSGDTVHAVLELENQSGVAVMFGIGAHIDSFEPHESQFDGAFGQPFTVSCHPARGLIPPNRSFPILLSCQPTGSARYRGKALVQLNNSPKDEIEIALSGESFLPALVIEDSSMIALRPTCVTGETRRRLKIYNPTCIPLAFDVSPSLGLAEVLHIDPAMALLDAGQQMELTLLFVPREAEVYEGHVNFSVFFPDTDHSSPSSHSSVDGELREERRRVIVCPCMGEGRHAVVEVEPVTMEHEGPAMQKETFEWTIYNSSVCEVCYEVRWLPRTGSARQQDQDEPPVQLSHNKTGTLAARSHTVVLVTLRPRAGVSDYILYTLVGGGGVQLSTIPHPTTLAEVRQHPHCEVRLKGTRPAIQIADVRSLEQQRSHLWCQLRINSVNAVLAAPVQTNDLESDSFAFLQYIRGLEPIFMDLGVGTVLHPKKEILLCVENAGPCPASFRFWYPTEHEGGNETWFLDHEELEDVQHILSERLIDISPREGIIPVGSRKVITITYFHTLVGTHCLPVLLRLNEGKKALLVLEARTVSPEANALAFHHPSLYNLHPVALGDLEPPLQTTTIENTTSKEVKYIVQEDLTQQVAEMNCGFPVFQCLNPTGTIPPGGFVHLHWYFRPLEARTYQIDVSMRTLDGEEYDVQFVGVGYHPKKVTAETACAMINNAFLPIPLSSVLQFSVERCPVTLSMDVMRVGAVPSFSLHRRVCYLENRHPRDTCSFSWSTQLEPGSSTLHVTPSSGVIGPGKRVRCLFALHCGSLSQVLETPILCHIHREKTPKRSFGKKHGVVEPDVTTRGKSADSRVVVREDEEMV